MLFDRKQEYTFFKEGINSLIKYFSFLNFFIRYQIYNYFSNKVTCTKCYRPGREFLFWPIH